jgi:hypothetical protein
MKFILMMHAPKNSEAGATEGGDWAIFKWPPAALKKHMDYLTALNSDLEKQGVLVAIDGLAPPRDAKLVKANPKGGAPITDGPFPEAKEFLAGWWIVDVERPEQAYEIAARASAAPGPDGKPLNQEIEVRQVMRAP